LVPEPPLDLPLGALRSFLGIDMDLELPGGQNDMAHDGIVPGLVLGVAFLQPGEIEFEDAAILISFGVREEILGLFREAERGEEGNASSSGILRS
jgi:hypothetical protein